MNPVIFMLANGKWSWWITISIIATIPCFINGVLNDVFCICAGFI